MLDPALQGEGPGSVRMTLSEDLLELSQGVWVSDKLGSVSCIAVQQLVIPHAFLAAAVLFRGTKRAVSRGAGECHAMWCSECQATSNTSCIARCLGKLLELSQGV